MVVGKRPHTAARIGCRVSQCTSLACTLDTLLPEPLFLGRGDSHDLDLPGRYDLPLDIKTFYLLRSVIECDRCLNAGAAAGAFGV